MNGQKAFGESLVGFGKPPTNNFRPRIIGDTMLGMRSNADLRKTPSKYFASSKSSRLRQWVRHLNIEGVGWKPLFSLYNHTEDGREIFYTLELFPIKPIDDSVIWKSLRLGSRVSIGTPQIPVFFEDREVDIVGVRMAGVFEELIEIPPGYILHVVRMKSGEIYFEDEFRPLPDRFVFKKVKH
jgi:hypothetical protein